MSYIKSVEKQVIRAREAYYNTDKPIISDNSYDQLEALLRRIDPMNALLNEQSVGTGGSKLRPERGSVIHSQKLLSVTKFYSIEEILAWISRLDILKREVSISSKLDGMAVVLSYIKGNFNHAVTRGDGVEGQDITDSVIHMSSIPKKLPVPYDIEIRGEAVVSSQEFVRLNGIQEAAGEKPFTHPRNVAVGAITTRDWEKSTRVKNVDFIAYDALGDGTKGTFTDNIDLISSLGFNTIKCYTADKDSEITSMIEKVRSFNKDWNYSTDGVVIRINDNASYYNLGNNDNSYYCHCALKPEQEFAITRIEKIAFEVSRKSVLTPVAYYTPTFISGAMCREANIASIQMLRKMDLHVGDTVLVVRRGLVIPVIVANLSSRTINDNLVKEGEIDFNDYPTFERSSEKVYIPLSCPTCGSPTRLINDEVNLLCTREPECTGSTARRLDFFCKVLGIKYMGEEMARKILAVYPDLKFSHIIKIAEMYPIEGLTGNLERIQKQAEIAHAALKADCLSRHLLFTSIGPDNIGEKRALKLFEAVSKLDSNLESLQVSDILDHVTGTAEKSAIQIKESLDASLAEYYDLCLAWDISPYTKIDAPEESRGTFCVTGTLSQPRKVIVSMLEEKGYSNSSGVSKNLDFLVCGDKAGSKRAKAEKLGVRIISEKDLDSL